MASKRAWLGMLVMVLVFGMAVVGCDTSGNGGGGNTGGGGCHYVQLGIGECFMTVTDIVMAGDRYLLSGFHCGVSRCAVTIFVIDSFEPGILRPGDSANCNC